MNRRFFKIFIILTLFYLAFQTKPWTSIIGNIYYHDDNSYYGYVSTIVNDFDFDISNNKISGYSGPWPTTGRIYLHHPIGTSIFLIPFYTIAKPVVCLINGIKNIPFNQRDPLLFMFMSAGILLYAYLGAYFLFKALLLLGANKNNSLISVILCVWGTAIPAFIFKRPIFYIIPEFFLISLVIYFVIKCRDIQRINFKQIFLLGILAGVVFITRWNDLHILLFIICFLSAKSYASGDTFKKRLFKLAFFFIIVSIIFIFTQGLAWKYFFNGDYLGFIAERSQEGRPFSILLSLSTITNFFHIFIGQDWGLFYTMLPLAIGLVTFFWFNPLAISKWRLLDRIIYLILFSLPFLIVLKWAQHGGYYGYRHLLSLLPFSCLGLTFFLDRLVRNSARIKKYIVLFAIIILSFNFFLMLPFEYQQSTTLEPGISPMGGFGWVNPSYVSNALKIYFTPPMKNVAGLFTRGFLGGYIFGAVYLISPETFSKLAGLNEKVQKYYALDSVEKWFALLYPLLAVLMLTVVCGLGNKVNNMLIKKKKNKNI